MLFVLSPAKALDYETPAVTSRHTAPLFVPQSKALIEVLRDARHPFSLVTKSSGVERDLDLLAPMGQQRLAAVRAFAALPEAPALAAANKRVGNILKKAEGAVQPEVNPALLKEAAAPAGSATPDDLWSHARRTRDLLAGSTAKRTREVAGDRLLTGTARFTGPDTVDVNGQPIHAQAFIVATGSRPVVPQALAALGDRLLTTDSLFDLDTLPGSVGMLGLGAIGLW